MKMTMTKTRALAALAECYELEQWAFADFGATANICGPNRLNENPYTEFLKASYDTTQAVYGLVRAIRALGGHGPIAQRLLQEARDLLGYRVPGPNPNPSATDKW